MSTVQLKVYQHRCDGGMRAGGRLFACPAQSTPVADVSEPPLPRGWGRVEHRDCGMTGYTDVRIYCPMCLARIHDDDEEEGE